MFEPSRHPPSGFIVPKPPNVVVLEDFQILRKLGSGTMGAVYLARQISQDRDVALKMLAQSLVEKPDFVERFSREGASSPCARSSQYCPHPWRRRRARLLLLRDGVRQRFHASAVRARRAWRGRMTIEDALYFTLKCAAGLHHAHHQRVVHRDVGPENLMINQHLGEVKITDLGLAKSHRGRTRGLTDSRVPASARRATSGPRAGPQRQERRSLEPTSTSLGCTLYELLTGRLPFDAETSMELDARQGKRAIFRRPDVSNRQVPPRLELFLDKMLAKDLRVCATRNLRRPDPRPRKPGDGPRIPELQRPANRQGPSARRSGDR